VSLSGLHVAFGQVTAVRSLDLDVAPAESVALVGRNGAGKSTTLRVLAGVIPPHGGKVTVDGHDLARSPEAVKRAIGYCPDVGGLIPRATPWEHLQLAAQLRGLAEWEAHATMLLERFDLTAAADRITATFSHGMGRRTSVMLAAFHAPSVLLLDEPFDGVDPLGVDATLATIHEAQQAGAAVIVSTHLIDLAVQACRRAVVLSGGEVVARCDASDLSGDEGRALYRQLLAPAR
jgi:ABC-2 type transport system ATP-binding protein